MRTSGSEHYHPRLARAALLAVALRAEVFLQGFPVVQPQGRAIQRQQRWPPQFSSAACPSELLPRTRISVIQ